MKKALALILCAVALSLMVACGGNLNQTINSTPSSPSVPSTPSSPSSPDSTLSSTVDSELSDSTTQSSTVSSETVSSTNDSTTQSTIQSTTQSTHQSTTTSSTTASSRPAPVITEDMTPYKVNVVGTGDNRVIKYVNDTFSYPIITPYYNGYKTALTMTFDDGYDTGTGTIVSDMFEKYGYRGTMMIGPCFINGEEYITEWNKIFARGYLDLGCHGYNHKEPTTLPSSEYEHEIKDAIMFLREKFPGQRVLTFATPYAHINDAYESYLSQFVLGNRLAEAF